MYYFFLILISLLVGCSSAPLVKQNEKEYKPDFVEFFPRHKGLIFGIASVVDTNAIMARMKADHAAEQEVVFHFAAKTQNAVMATFIKAELSSTLYNAFIDELQEVMLTQSYPETVIDQREYVMNKMYSLAKCAYSHRILAGVKDLVYVTVREYDELYRELVARHLLDEMNERIDLLEEY